MMLSKKRSTSELKGDAVQDNGHTFQTELAGLRLIYELGICVPNMHFFEAE